MAVTPIPQEAFPLSDPTACPNCAAPVPAGASFCTSCGHNLVATPPAPTPAGDAPAGDLDTGARPDAGSDPTAITSPGLHDTTQVLPEAAPPEPAPSWGSPPDPAPAPPAWAPAAAGAASAPWAPAAPPTTTPPAVPPPPEAPAWQSPTAPPGFAPPPGAPVPPAWQAPGAPPVAPTAWPPPAPVEAAPSTSPGSPLGGIAAILAAALVLVGVFTAWIGTDQTSETVKGWDLTSGDKFFKSSDPYLLLALGIVALVLAVALFTGRYRTPARIASIVLGLAVIAICIKDWTDIADLVKKTPAFKGTKITAEFGFYLTIAGGVLAIVAGLMPAKKR
jgi:hypothetical protein